MKMSECTRRTRKIWKHIRNLFQCSSCLSSNDRLFHEDGSLIDHQRLREYISTRSLSSKERQLMWPYLLNVYSPHMTNEEKNLFRQQTKIHYEKLKRQWQERLARSDAYYLRLADTILKDISRTDQHISFLKKRRSNLFNVMMTYSVYHPDPGYCQGMSDVLTPLMYIFDDESMSYICYCSLISRYMNIHFDRNEKELSRRYRLFHLILPSIDVELWKTLSIDQETSSNYFYRWFFLDCKREFSQFDQSLRVLELVWLYSISRFSKTISTWNDSSLFIVFLSISILQEDRKYLLSSLSDEQISQYFFSSSSFQLHRSSNAMKRILQRAQFYHSLYTCPSL